MSEIFTDTGYGIALIDRRDQGHGKGFEISADIADRQIVTTEMVLTELLNFASGQGEYLQRLAGETARQRYHEPSLEEIRQTTGLFQEALERYLTRPDQGWSLVDCASFVVMETLRTR